jgi:hypothetical protein
LAALSLRDALPISGAILRQLYAVVVHQQAWDPIIAARGTTWLEVVAA